MAEQRIVDLDDLLLDHQNPRLGSVDSQPEALRELVQMNARYFAEMMESIKENGLDPGNLFFLIDEADQTGVEGYTVVDGNRRFAALAVLREPALLVGADLPESTVRNLRSIADGFDRDKVGESRLSILFSSRAEADDWITRRHGRDRGGEGQVFWGPLEIQRFTGDRSLLDILDFVDRSGTYEAADWGKVRAKISKRSSVLRRFIESKAGISALGLGEEEYDGGKRPTSTREPAYLAGVLKKLFDDINEGRVTTRTHNKADDLQAYFDKLEPQELRPANAKSARIAKSFHDLSLRQPSTPKSPSSNPKSATTQPVKIRDTLAPARQPFQQPTSEKGKQFVREAVKTKLKSNPLSAAFLLRGFIQHVVDLYMRSNGLPLREGGKALDLSVRSDRVIDHLIQNGKATASSLNGIRRRLGEPARKGAWSIAALNDYHHDEYQVPTPDVLRSGWDDADALFVAVLGRAV